jgi:hypothetical protein
LLDKCAPSLIKQYAMNTVSHHGRFSPGEGTPSTHWTGGWVGPTAYLNAVGKRNI